jgi:hypothetical protein
LAELSTYEPLAEKIAAVNGSILILVGLTSSTSENLVIVQKAEEILKNLEDSIENVKQMAENGRLQPLLKHLVQGKFLNFQSVASGIILEPGPQRIRLAEASSFDSNMRATANKNSKLYNNV